MAQFSPTFATFKFSCWTPPAQHIATMSPPSAFVPALSFRLTSQSTHRTSSYRSPRRPVQCRVQPSTILSEDEMARWDQAANHVRQLGPGVGGDDAVEKVIGTAFGWGVQKFWKGRVKQEVPSPEIVEEALQFLREQIGLSDDDVIKVVKKFPEVLRVGIERMNENLEYVQRSYPHIKGTLLKNSVKDTPAVLGFDFDCEGDCKSECARCWVQFWAL